MRYTIRCRGELLPDAVEGEVAERLQAEFALEPGEAQALLDGRRHFVRSGLDRFTADHYLALFQRSGLGAECEVAETITPSPNLSAERIESAAEGGTHNTDPATGEEPIESRPIGEHQRMRRRANRWLVVGATLYGIAFMLDDYLDMLVMMQLSQSEIGYLPYLLATLSITIGAVDYVRLKGYPAWLGVIGLSGLLGVGVLLLLPERGSGRLFGVRGGKALFAMLLVGSGLWWVAGFGLAQLELRQLEREGGELRLGRNEYPQRKLDSEFSAELAELNDYLERGFALLQEDGLSTDQAVRLAEQMFAETSRYLTWHNYQSYLHVSEYGELPEALDGRNAPLKQLYDRARLGSVRSARVEVVRRFGQWYEGAPADERAGWTAKAVDKLRRALFRARVARRGEKPPIEEVVAALPAAVGQGEIVAREGGRITLRLPLPEGEATLVLVYYAAPRSDSSGRRRLSDRMRRIGGDLPDPYLPGALQHFERWFR